MVKIRYRNCYPREIVREAEIWNVILSEDINGLVVHYNCHTDLPGMHYSVLGTYQNREGYIDFISSLVINGTEYRAEWIRAHFAEVQVLLDQERMEMLLKEIDA